MLRTLKRIALQLLPSSAVVRLAASAALAADELELHFLDLLCRSDRCSIDVGANTGVYSWHMLRYSRSLVAIEAHPRFAALLTEAFKGNARVVHTAMSDTAGSVTLHVPLHGGQEADTRSSLETSSLATDKVREIEVDARTLDSLGCENVGFIKIDVEGHEMAVLRGAHQCLENHQPRVLLEVVEQHRPGCIKEVFSLFSKLNYVGFFLWGNKALSTECFNVAEHQGQPQAKRFGSGRTGRYANNFVFVPEAEGEAMQKSLEQRLRSRSLHGMGRAASSAAAVFR